MTCEQAELRMAELLAGEIAAEDRSLLEKHLLDCAACRGDFELARAGARIEWADVPVPKEVVEATLASFREPAPVVRLFRWATAAAAVFGLAALLIASSRTAPNEKEPMPVAAARPQVLATMQDAAVGAMVCKDESGRPVGELGLKSHEVSVEILDGIAKTTVEENFENHTDRRLEGTFNFPLPSDASISRLALEVNGKIEEGTCLERERAREVFEGIVRRMQDPALLEWQLGGFFKCRVFPIEPRATKRVIVAYTQALPCFQGKMTYVYPLASEKTRTHAPEEVRIGVQARFSGALAKIESPSHHLEVQRRNGNEASMSFRAAHYRPNNDFVVTMEPGPEEVRVVSHKTDGEDGYFACFATPQGGGERKPARYAFVLDASASTSAPRLEVAKRLVREMMERRIDGDRFEILAHHIEVERSGDVDLRAANTFMDKLRPIGGSDVLQALLAAGDAEVIYIGKGAPTFGELESSKILEAVKGRRIRTIAVGSDANVQLLERLGGMMRVSPNDDVAKRVAEIAATLGAPVLSDVKLEGGDAVYDVVGVRDLFYGERLVVSGRYRGPASKVVITGRGYRREVEVAFPTKEEGNNYVRRLWAQRKVADLLAQGPAKKPEVTDLGVKYQIMTPYTSFLVLETEKMWQDHQLKREVQKQDEVLGKKEDDDKKRMAEAEASASEVVTKRIAILRMAELLQQSYSAWEGRQYDRTMKLCDEILKIDPHYPVAKDLKEGADKERHRPPPQDLMTPKVSQWKALTQAGSEPVIPMSQTVRFPNRAEWGNIVKSFDRTLLPGQTPQEQERQYESQRHHEQAMEFRYAHEWAKAKGEAAKALECWQENTEARRFMDELGKDEFRVTMDQARIEITKHVRDGQRYFNARMYEQAKREYEDAEFKILNLPSEQKELTELLPVLGDSISKSRNAKILEERRTETEKKRMAEAEATAAALPRPRDVAPGIVSPEPKMPEMVKPPPPPALKPEPRSAPVEPAPVAKPEPIRPVEVPKPTPPPVVTPTVSDPTPRNPRAEELYKLAERRFQAGDFEKAEEMSLKALEVDPNFAAARALYTENGFILGKGKTTPTSGEYDKFMKEALVRHQQTLTEVDAAQERGRQAYRQGDYEQAEREFRKIIEFSKWMPTGIELEARRKSAAEMLDLTRNLNDPKKFWIDNGEVPSGYVTLPTEGGLVPPDIFSLTTNVAAPGAPITDALPVTIEGESPIFFPEARGRRDPFTKTKLNTDLPTRQPKGLSEMAEELSGEDQAIRERMRTARVTVDMTNAPIPAIVDELRTTTGLNIVAPPNNTPDADLVTFKVKDQTIDQALRQMLEPRGKTYEVRNGVVVIVPIVQQGGNVNVAPKKAIDGRVTAVDSASGLVVISLGKDDGVLEGDEFSVKRGAEIVAKLVLDRADRKWAAGKMVLKNGEPRVGDDVTNRIFVQSGEVLSCVATTAVTVADVSEDGTRVRLNGLVIPGQVCAVTRAGKFVAMVRVGESGDATLMKDFSVGRILPGDRVQQVTNLRGFLAALPLEVRLDLASRASQQAIRAKMGLKE